MKKNIIIILGASAAGKDTVARLLEKNCGYKFIVSTTTRPPRSGESNGNPYYFIDNEMFKNLIDTNSLIEYREYHTTVKGVEEVWYYGVEKSEVDIENNNYIAVLDTVGLLEFKEHFPESVISFFLKAGHDIRKGRCIARGDFDECEWNRRQEDDATRFSDDIIKDEVDYIINAEDTPENVLSQINNAILTHNEEKNRN